MTRILTGASATCLILITLACGGGVGGVVIEPPSDRAVRFAESRVRSGYDDEPATAVSAGQEFEIGHVAWVFNAPHLEPGDDEIFGRRQRGQGLSTLVVPFTWTSLAPVQTEGTGIDIAAYDEDGNELGALIDPSYDRCPDQERPWWDTLGPSDSGECAFLFPIDPSLAGDVVMVIGRTEKRTDPQYIWHVRRDQYVVDLGSAIAVP